MGFKTFIAKIDDAKLRASVVGAGLLAPVLSFAQTTDPFEQAKSDILTKIGLWGGGLVMIAAAGVASLVAMKYVKKIRGAA